MGIDVEIYFTAEGGPSELDIPSGFGSVVPTPDYIKEETGATHCISTLCRYYGIGYERGNWPQICGILMSLFASPEVKKIWYFGDCFDLENCTPITIEEILTISYHYMLNGGRPYHDRAVVITKPKEGK